ncbi:MAG TPA: HigA family addiction module antidote protein [Dehalococcoidia bacterium]|nr:HigA family addiction module antidote protein [Dehalococcoidia bacterium]
MNKTAFQYEPDYAIAPGEILEDTLQSRGMQKIDLAERCGLSAKQMSLIVSGKAPITPETAINLERVLGVSANIWNNLEARFRLHKARKLDYDVLSRYEEWLESFPLNELEKRGIIDKDDSKPKRIAQLLGFFGVGSVATWQERCKQLQVSFRRSPAFKSSVEAVVTWIRIGEL